MKAGEISSPFPIAAIIKNPFGQLIGIFTRPSAVFDSLRIAPKWLGALVFCLGITIPAAKIYSIKHNLSATIQQLEKHGLTKTPSPAGQKAYKLISESMFIQTSTLIIGLFTLAMTLYIFWRLAGEDDQIGFRQTWAVAIVHSLALLPATLLQNVFCMIRPAGSFVGYSSITPTSLLFWIPIENTFARGILYILDPFYIFSLIALALGCRYTLRLKAWALRTCLLIVGLYSLFYRFTEGML